MNIRILLALLLGVAIITGCGGGGSADRAVPTPPATNNDGSVVTGIITPEFNPSPGGVIPLPNSLLRARTTDLTLNPPVDDPTDYSDPFVALSALDGWSTTERWIVQFVEEEIGISDVRPPATINPATVIPGSTVRFFEVTVDPLLGVVLGVNHEMTPGQDYVAVASGGNLAIIPLRPHKELTAYMAVLTSGIQDMDGNDSTPDQAFFLAKKTQPLVDASGNSTVPLLPDANAQLLEPLRQIVQTHLAAAASQGIDPDDVTVTWTAITQGIKPVTKILRSLAQPAPTTIASAGVDTTAIGGFGLADISIGVITLPYYLEVPSPANPTAALTGFWKAAPGAYIPPFDALGLDPTSTHVTAANPIPVLNDMQTVPILVTTPSANSGMVKPPAGWPVVIFGHGLTGNRTHALAVADTLASIGYAMVAMDFPLHGISPDVDPGLGLFYVENTPFAPFANERTFDMDLQNNATGAPGPDLMIDASGAHVIPAALGSLLTGRDILRQGEVDLSVLAVSVPSMDIDGDGLPDFDGSNIAYAGFSWGAVQGAVFAAVEPTVTRAFLSVPGGGIARYMDASPTFGPPIRAALQAAAGIEPGSADYELFLIAWQTVIDSADPVNWFTETSEFNAILLHEVIGDTVIPNFSATAPLTGTDPLIILGGLDVFSSARSDPAGVRAAARFLPPATHGSLLSPAFGSPAATAEMQGQMASFIWSFGTAVTVADPSVLDPE
jgi:hypothetical protein